MDKLCVIRKYSALLLAMACIVSLPGCEGSKKNKRADSGAAMSENRSDTFSEKLIDIPEEFSTTPEFICSSDKIFLPGQSESRGGFNIGVTVDISTGKTQTVDVSAVNGIYIISQCMNQDMIYLSYHNNDSDIKLCCLNRKTGELVAEVPVESASYVTSMQFDTDKDRLITMNADISDEPIVHTLNVYDPTTLELMDSVDLNEKLALGENDYLNTMLINNEGGYYVTSYNMESNASEYTLYKLSGDLEKIYTVNDFGDIPGDMTDGFISSDGSICIVTADYDNKTYYINKLSAADGQSLGVYEMDGNNFFTILKYAPVEEYDFTYSAKDGIYGYTIEGQKSTLIASTEATGKSFEYCTGVASYGNNLFMLSFSNEYINTQKVYTYDMDGNNTGIVELVADSPEGYIDRISVSPDGTIYALESFPDNNEESYSMSYSIHKISADGKEKKVFLPEQLSKMKANLVEKIMVSPDNNLYVIMPLSKNNVTEKDIMVFDSDGKFINQIISQKDVFDIIYTKENDYLVYKNDNGKISLSAIDYENHKAEEKKDTEISEILKSSFYSGTGDYDAFYQSSEGIYGYNIKEKESTCIFDQEKSGTDIAINNYLVIDDDKIVCSVFNTEKALSEFYILTRD